ncbi:tyrosine-type recombinase/integrase [Lactococcus garvieae]|uniref:Phage integrase n=1 Tax=Lactococcus garvieae DCC43 TaxID=1231377 RepID=K2PN06_9LACT|nr:site-specific integrase [Lactococcus garvieae]EKF51584.1 phage integrase [Lactococcus garvieae DCC43]
MNKKIQKNKELKKVKKADGSTVLVGQVYLGIDSITKKRRNTTIRASTVKQWKLKAQQAKKEFQDNGCTTFKESHSLEMFDELVEDWLKIYSSTIRTNTLLATKGYLRHYIMPAFSKIKIVDISPRMISGVVKRWAINADTAIIKNGRREKGKGKDYVNALNILRKLFDHAFDLNIIDTNPAIGIKVPRPKKREVAKKLKYFNNEQLKIWFSYLESLELNNKNLLEINLYMLLLDTGIRIGEALALNWSDIDFKNKKITISKTVVYAKLQNNTKSSKSRDIFITDKTIQRLNNWKKVQYSISNTISINDKRLLFPNHNATYARNGVFYNRLKNHFEKAGLPNIGLHGFRHTHATLLLNNGADYKEIQDRLGHSSISITMDTYSHLSQNKAMETAELFSKTVESL